MSTATVHKVWTYADLEAMPESEDGRRYEIIDGELIVTPSPIPFHQSLSLEATIRIAGVVRSGDLGRVLTAPVDVTLADGAVVVPDIVFVRRDRLDIIGPKAIEGPPDLIVEILSPSTKRRDQVAKKALYARNGVREYWIIDPEARTLGIFALRGDRFEPLPGNDGVVRSEVLSGLAIDVAALFAAAEA